jgi:hypothetical protein
MFLVKKFLTAWLLPPALFVALLVVGARHPFLPHQLLAEESIERGRKKLRE